MALIIQQLTPSRSLPYPAMGWATRHIERLRDGETVKFRPTGGSMRGRIESGQLVTVIPLDRDPLVGDIVLCKVHGHEYLHLVKAVQTKEPRYQIGNNHGRINGWVNRSQIFGRCTTIEP